MISRVGVLCVLLVALCGCASPTEEARVQAMARDALSNYASRFRQVDAGIGVPGLTYFGQARWSQMPGLCVADVMLVVPRRGKNGGGVHSILLSKIYGAVGELRRADVSDMTEAEVAREEAACAAVTDVMPFFHAEDEDTAFVGALAFQALNVPDRGLTSVRWCEDKQENCLILQSGQGAVHTTRVIFQEGPPVSIATVEDEVTYPVD